MTNPLVMSGFAVLLINFLAHCFGVPAITRPFGFPAVMTVFSSLSFLGLLIFFCGWSHRLKVAGLLVSLLVQMVSLALLMNDWNSHWLFFVPSSLPTSLFLISLSFTLIVIEFVWTENSFRFAVCAVFISGLAFLFFSFVTSQLSYLGVIPHRPGVGLSVQTFFMLLVIVGLACQKYLAFVSLKSLSIDFHPLLCLVWMACLMASNFGLMILEFPSSTTWFVALNTVFLFVGLYLFLFPFLRGRDRVITVCSWSGQIRWHKDQWVSLSEVARDLDVCISHGISPEEKKKIKQD